MRSWLVALRIARREARRAKWRTALIVTMIAVPIAALSFAAATYDMYKLTPTEKVTRMMGTASATMNWQSDDPVVQVDTVPTKPTHRPHTAASLLSLLPTGSRLSPYWQRGVEVHTATGIGGIEAVGLDASDPLAAGMVHVDSGRAPRTAGEVAASPSALARLGLHVGDTLHTAGDSAQSSLDPVGAFTIVGTVEVSGSLYESLLFAPDQLPDADSWLVGTPGPVTESQVHSLGLIGIQVTSRALVLDPPPDLQPDSTATIDGFSYFGIGTLITGLGLLEVVLLAGPAFAVGARRRQRDLALVATAGGTPSTLRRIVLADGIVGGIAAAVVGVVTGLAVAVIGRPWLENHLVHARFGAYRVSPLMLAAVVGLALATGIIGALVPAFTASRQDVVAALTGRRGVVRSRAVWLVLGLVGIGFGALIAFAGAYRHASNVVLFGLVVGELGMVLCTPTIVGIVSRIGRFLPVAPRIALRDTARRRAAAAPAISAVMAAVAGSVALTVYLGASYDRDQGYQQMLPIGSAYVQLENAAAGQIAQIDATLAKIMPGSSTVTVSTVDQTKQMVSPVVPVSQKCPYEDQPGLSAATQRRAAADPRCTQDARMWGEGGMTPVATTDPAVVAGVLGLRGTALTNAVAALDRGLVVVSDPRFVTNGEVTVALTDPNGDTKTFTLPAAAAPPAEPLLVTTLMPPSVLPKLGLVTKVFGVVVTPRSMPTQAQQDAFTAQFNDGAYTNAYIEFGPNRDKQIIALILAIAAGVIAIGAAAIATGLASVDGRSDLQTLGAVGATPRVRRVLALSQAGVIAGLGSLLGAVAGFGAGAAVLYGLNQVYAGKWPAPSPYPIEVPWLNLGVSLLVVPLVAILGAGLLTRSRLPSERRAD